MTGHVAYKKQTENYCYCKKPFHVVRDGCRYKNAAFVSTFSKPHAFGTTEPQCLNVHRNVMFSAFSV
jgi:hypothetical protein